MADDAAEVADDYRQALEDLSVNSRIEIATLTNIARENANHGLAIAEVLQNHIKKVCPFVAAGGTSLPAAVPRAMNGTLTASQVPPPKTLPALYVLDSVVKNVPTPYSLYFGPKLYSIFMNAYTKVDKDTRRKMDEMLRTWKEPVPGSISTKPVFPPEVVRPIEHALIAARNVAFVANHNSFQGQQQLLRGARPPARETPTPPTGRLASHAGLAQGQRPPLGQASQMPPQSMAQQPYPMRPHNVRTLPWKIPITLLTTFTGPEHAAAAAATTTPTDTTARPSTNLHAPLPPAPTPARPRERGRLRSPAAGDKHRKAEG